jgi:hypothetical protein
MTGMTLAAGPVWTFWIAVPLAAMAVVSLVLVVAGYLKFVTAQRYPKAEE